jgi:hypothetical protein
MNPEDLKRHAVNQQVAEENFRYFCGKLPNWVFLLQRRGVNWCSWIAHDAIGVVSYGMVVEPTSPLIPRALRIAGQALAGMLKVARAGSKPVSFPIDDQIVTVTGPVDESLVELGAWLEAFFLNLLARQEEQLGWLMSFPRRIFRRSSTVAPKFLYQFADATAAFWLDAADADDQIQEALTAMNRPRKDKWPLAIGKPLLRLMQSLRAGGPAFEALLIEGLRWHKIYWTSNEDWSLYPDGFVAYPLCALAGLAYDRGIPFNVESDYLPLSLVQGLGKRGPKTKSGG